MKRDRAAATGSQRALLLAILALAFFLRIYGINWDGGYLFHPDERQILMVTDRLSFPWPPDLALLFSEESPWNPSFFAYGSLPIYLLRVLSSAAAWFSPELGEIEGSYWVGRMLSALFDVGTIGLVYWLGKRLHGAWTGLLSALLVTITVLHIQLSHFYAVDTVLTFFVVLVIVLCVRLLDDAKPRRAIGIGLALGAALATKVSAAPICLTVLFGWLFGAALEVGRARETDSETRSWPIWVRCLLAGLLSALIAILTFVILEPYALIDWVEFASDLLTESYMARGLSDIPYTRQFIGAPVYLYPLWQLALWSMGLPLGALAAAGLGHVLVCCGVNIVRRRLWDVAAQALILVWVGVYFGIVGGFHAKFLRYMLPITPLLCLWAGWLGYEALERAQRAAVGWRLGAALGALIILGGTTAYALTYTNVYRQTHPWIQATAYLCEEAPKGTHLLIEHWDDVLPMVQADGTGLDCWRQMRFHVFPAYNPDTSVKRDDPLDDLVACDYVVLASNRLYNTIPRLPERDPFTPRYYELLLSEQLGFELDYYAAVYPALGGVHLVDETFRNPDLPKPQMMIEYEAEQRLLNLGRADESYSVYDHPKPMVFRKTEQLSADELLMRFGEVAEGLPEPDSD